MVGGIFIATEIHGIPAVGVHGIELRHCAMDKLSIAARELDAVPQSIGDLTIGNLYVTIGSRKAITAQLIDT